MASRKVLELDRFGCWLHRERRGCARLFLRGGPARGIPPETLEYVVNGKPAVAWIIERYQVTADKDSGIVDDPNDWATWTCQSSATIG